MLSQELYPLHDLLSSYDSQSPSLYPNLDDLYNSSPQSPPAGSNKRKKGHKNKSSEAKAPLVYNLPLPKASHEILAQMDKHYRQITKIIVALESGTAKGYQLMTRVRAYNYQISIKPLWDPELLADHPSPPPFTRAITIEFTPPNNSQGYWVPGRLGSWLELLTRFDLGNITALSLNTDDDETTFDTLKKLTELPNLRLMSLKGEMSLFFLQEFCALEKANFAPSPHLTHFFLINEYIMEIMKLRPDRPDVRKYRYTTREHEVLSLVQNNLFRILRCLATHSPNLQVLFLSFFGNGCYKELMRFQHLQDVKFFDFNAKIRHFDEAQWQQHRYLLQNCGVPIEDL